MKTSPKRLRMILYASTVLFWLVTMTLLFIRHFNGQSAGETRLARGNVSGDVLRESWMGIYRGKERIGYSFSHSEPVQGGYAITSKLVMNILMMGAPKKVETLLTAAVGPDFSIRSFHFLMKADVTLKVDGRVQGSLMTLSITGADRTHEKSIRLNKIPHFDLSLSPVLLKQRLSEGGHFSFSIFDPSSLSLQEIDLEVAGREELSIMGALRTAHKLDVKAAGNTFSVWIADDGEVLREESPLGLILVREHAEDAVQITSPVRDLVEQASVPFNLRLTENVRYLKVRVSGVDLNNLALDGGRQRLSGDVLEITREDLDDFRKVNRKLPREHLGESIFVQSEDPAVVSLAKEIVKDADEVLEKARHIQNWVFRNIEKVPSLTFPMATDVLRTRKGDCNEHTVLFTALARASGVPARMALGLVYRKGSFYYHAWPEIFSGDWLAVDPTLDQFPADASHIRLLIGEPDQQVLLLSVLGKIRLEGMEQRH